MPIFGCSGGKSAILGKFGTLTLIRKWRDYASSSARRDNFVYILCMDISRLKRVKSIRGHSPLYDWAHFSSLLLLYCPIHTNPFSNENGAVLLRIRLSSTLQPRKRSPKTEPFENAIQSGAI